MTKMEVIREAERTFGFVPGIIEKAPESVVVPLWGMIKDLLSERYPNSHEIQGAYRSQHSGFPA